MGAGGFSGIPTFADDKSGIGVEGAAPGLAEVGWGGEEAIVGGLGVDLEVIAVVDSASEAGRDEAETTGTEFFEGGGVPALLGRELRLGGVEHHHVAYRRNLVATVFSGGDVDIGEKSQCGEEGCRGESRIRQTGRSLQRVIAFRRPV